MMARAPTASPAAPGDWKHSRRTIWLLALVVATFLAWATHAPLEIIVRGNGQVVPSMRTQVVQHLEGGIVREIFVVEGDEVAAGQKLSLMDATQFQSAYQELQEQRLALLIKLERLRAEQDPEAEFVPSQQYRLQAAEYAESEQALFNARKEQFSASLTTLTEMARLLRSEVALLRPMVDQSAVPEIELIRAEKRAIEAEGQIAVLQTEFETQRSEAFSDALVTLRQIEEQIRARQDQLDRTDIRSPVRGIVNRVAATTVGGVVRSGDTLVEILPLDRPLRVEARIDPRDIGFVVSAMPAKIKLTAFDYAIYGSLHGRVVHVGADTVVDENQRDPQPYYEVFIALEATSLNGPEGPVEIRPGMQAVVELQAGNRTVLQYLLTPLFRSSEALRER